MYSDGARQKEYPMNKQIPHECGAKTRSGGKCHKHPGNNGRCRLHGGASLVGVASPRFKHGRYSKYMPASLAERYEKLSESALFKQHREGLALVQARISQLLEQIGEGGVADQALLINQLELLESSIIRGQIDQSLQIVRECKEYVNASDTDTKQWHEISRLIEQSRKLVDSDAKQRFAFDQVLTVDETVVFVSRVATLVKHYVTDEDAVRRIANELREFLEHRHD